MVQNRVQFPSNNCGIVKHLPVTLLFTFWVTFLFFPIHFVVSLSFSISSLSLFPHFCPSPLLCTNGCHGAQLNVVLLQLSEKKNSFVIVKRRAIKVFFPLSVFISFLRIHYSHNKTLSFVCMFHFLSRLLSPLLYN